MIGFDAPAPSAAANLLLSSATARLSLQLPPGTSTAAATLAIETHLLSRPPFGATVSLRIGTASEAWSDGLSGADALEALTAAWGTQALTIEAGGGIPVVSALAQPYPPAPRIIISAVTQRTAGLVSAARAPPYRPAWRRPSSPRRRTPRHPLGRDGMRWLRRTAHGR